MEINKIMNKKINFKNLFHLFLNKSAKEKITIVVLAGVLLLVISLPVKKSDDNTQDTKEKQTQESQKMSNEEYAQYLENKLTDILGKVDGVGEIKVFVTIKNTGKKTIASDNSLNEQKINETDSSGGSRVTEEKSSSNTNIFYDTQTGSEPYVTQESMPEVEGIIIVARGGGDGTVAANITSAVEALLNVPTHKIKVLKMS